MPFTSSLPPEIKAPGSCPRQKGLAGTQGCKRIPKHSGSDTSMAQPQRPGRIRRGQPKRPRKAWREPAIPAAPSRPPERDHRTGTASGPGTARRVNADERGRHHHEPCSVLGSGGAAAGPAAQHARLSARAVRAAQGASTEQGAGHALARRSVGSYWYELPPLRSARCVLR